MPTTEIASLPLASDADIGDPKNYAAVVLRDCLQTVSLQDGAETIHFGTSLESHRHRQLRLLIDWTSNAQHDAFIAAPHYQPFLQRFQTILASDPPPNPLFHVDFASSAALAACLAANVTETITLAWDAAPAGPPANFISSVHDFIATCHAAAAAGDGDGDGDGRVPGLRAHAAGTSHEELLVTGITATAMDPTTWTGTEPARWTGTAAGRVAVVVLGWDSVAAQKQFRGTAAFRGKLELLRQGAAGAQMGNTPFMRFWPDFASTSLGV